MARMHGGRRPNEKAKDFKGTMKKLIRYMAIYKVQVFFVAVFAICGTIFNIVGPKILGKATTEIFNGLVSKVSGGDGMNFGKIGQILLTVFCLYVISAICSFVQGYLMTGVSQKTTYRLRREISEKINRMPMSYFDTKPVGEVLSRVTNDVDTLGQSLNQSATQMITSVTTLIGVFIMMLSISPLMTVIAVLILPLSAGLIGFVMKHSQKYFVGQQEYLGNVNGQVEEIYSGHNIIKAFNKEEAVIREFNETNGKLYDSAWKSQFFSGMMMPVMQFIGNLGYVGVAVLGGFLTIKNVIEVGDIQSFIQYVRNFTQPIQQMAQVANMLQSTAAASERVFEFLEEKEVPTITKKRHTYLTYYGLEQQDTYVLKEGIVKTSIILRDGREFNISYIKGPDIISLLKDEVSQYTSAPFNVRIESETATFYRIPRVLFWDFVIQDPEL